MIAPHPNARVRVVVVDDSPICRALLREVLEADADVEVVGEASSANEAFERVREMRPDLVTMDVRMPGASGLEAVTRLMRELPTPILIVTEIHVGVDDGIVFEATRRGALDVARKPTLGDRAAEHALRARVRLLSRVQVVRHSAHEERKRPVGVVDARTASRVSVIGVAASAGGPMALAALFSSLPRGFPACFAVVQHLPHGFASTFARFLAARSEMPVVVVTGPVALARGVILLATDSAHLVAVSKERFATSDAPPRAGHRPSADVLFESLAAHHGGSACGVVLSGIGRDGADGLLRMRARGARTIAEDESTAAVYGMPRAAKENGAAERILGIAAIPGAISRLVHGSAA
jgi:two-component system, chemotaxis family, protein-glutamate methylesterase/glutaminase